VASFGYDERTVADWERRAGQHCQAVHAELVQQGQVDLQHVQADELWVKLVGQRLWLALALSVPSRRWLGGVLGASRDQRLLARLVAQVRAAARSLAILVCLDGLAGYLGAFRRGLGTRQPTGKPGRPKLVPEAGLLIGQVVKQYAKRRVIACETRVAQGTAAAVAAVLAATRTGQQINTAFIERLNATFRARLAPLVRRSRALARQEASLEGLMDLVGCLYNFCTVHASLRRPAAAGGGRKWQERTPARAAGLTEHGWSVWELLHSRIPPPPWEPPRRRGRRPVRPRLIRWVLRPHRVILC
jgi:hypothetical protein